MSISRPRHFNEIKSEGGITPEQQATIDANTDKITSNWTINGDDIYYGTGNVGIGTASPSYPLEIRGFTGRSGMNPVGGPAGEPRWVSLNDPFDITLIIISSYRYLVKFIFILCFLIIDWI